MAAGSADQLTCLTSMSLDTVTWGYLSIPDGIRQVESDAAGALAAFERAAAYAERFGDADLGAMARLGRGRSLIGLGETRDGPRAPRRCHGRGDVRRAVAARDRHRLLRFDRGVHRDLRPSPSTGLDPGVCPIGPSASPTGCPSAAAAWSIAAPCCASTATGPPRSTRRDGPRSGCSDRHPSPRSARRTTSRRSCIGCAASSALPSRPTARPASWGRRTEPGLALLLLARGRREAARTMIERALEEAA